MLTTRILPVLLVAVQVVVVLGYMSGAIGTGSDMGLLFGQSSTPVTSASSGAATPAATSVVTPAATESPTSAPTPTWETVSISSQINEVVTPTPQVTPVTVVSTVSPTETAYFFCDQGLDEPNLVLLDAPSCFMRRSICCFAVSEICR